MQAAPMVLALDLATKTGVCFGVPGQKPRFMTKNFGANFDTLMRSGRAVVWAAEFIQTVKPDAVLIEAPMPPHASKNGDATVVALTLFGAIGGVMQAKVRNVQTAHVQTVRKSFLGVARPENPKDCVMRLCRALGWEPENTDEADAGALWWHACSLSAPNFVQPIPPLLQKQAIRGPYSGITGGML